MKNKRLWIIVGITLAVILTGVIVIASISGNQEPGTDPSESSTDISVADITENENSEITEVTDISIPDVSEDSDESTEPSENSDSEMISKDDIDPEDIVKPDESETIAQETSKVIEDTSNAAEETTVKVAEPVTEQETESTETQTSRIVIGSEERKNYSCGVAGHHCEGPETHAYITKLETNGCKYCGSHSCPSFYGTDEWGNAQYTPSLCPMYNAVNDPLNYCQVCGKPTGDGTNGTCVHFIKACNCPNCGKYVESRECHTCE